MSTPSEKPILMSGPMVRAILEGGKTQTRRVVKRILHACDRVIKAADGSESWKFAISGQTWSIASPGWIACPYGQPGERLWVRETWLALPPTGNKIEYRADHEDGAFLVGLNWRPSIFMPRKLSRINLEITGVRVERLQAITEEDASAEGVDYDPMYPAALTHRTAFAKGWDKLNAKRGYSWESNPFVWVIEFRKI